MRTLRVLALLALIVALFPAHHAGAATVDASYAVGEEPFGIAVDPTDGRVYVANSQTTFGTNSVSIIDPISGNVGAIRTSAPSNLIAVDAVNRRLYSSNADGTVQVFDLATLALEVSLPIGGLGIVVDAGTRRVYVAGSSHVAVIDGATNTVVLTRPALPGESWFGLAHDPALHQLYVTNISEAAPSLVVLDDRDLSIVHEIALPVAPRFAIAVDSAQQRVYVAGHDVNGNGWPGSMFYAIDGGTFAVLGSTAVPGFPGGIALDPAAHRIYLTLLCTFCSSGYREIDDRTFEVVKLVTTPWTLALPALHPDGRLYVGAWTSNVPDRVIAIDLENHAPAIASVSVTPSVPLTNSSLQVTATVSDPDLPSDPSGDVVMTYEWLRNGAVIPGATGTTLDLSAPGAGDRGDTIVVHVTASDGQLSTTAETSVTVGNTAPTVSIALSDAAPKTNALLGATTTAQDVDNDALTLTYAWLRNGAVIAGATGTTLDLSAAGNGDRGDTVTVRVTASDGELSATAETSVVVGNTAPTVSVSLSDATPKTNAVLRATVTGQDADNDALTYAYAWSVNGVVRRTAATTSTTDSFDLRVKGNGDNGDLVSVSVIASDGSASSSPATASATVTLGNLGRD